jgi:hypothetical protein
MEKAKKVVLMKLIPQVMFKVLKLVINHHKNKLHLNFAFLYVSSFIFEQNISNYLLVLHYLVSFFFFHMAKNRPM